MPCHDGPPRPFDLFEAREQIDNAVTAGKPKTPNMLQHLSMPAQAWVRQHKAIDARRSQIELNFKQVRLNALAKLTDQEKMALGVGNWGQQDSE